MKRLITLFLAALLLCLSACSAPDKTVTLTDAYTLVCPEDADTNITQAALLLQTFLKELDGIQGDSNEQSESGGDGNRQNAEQASVFETLEETLVLYNLYEIAETEIRGLTGSCL